MIEDFYVVGALDQTVLVDEVFGLRFKVLLLVVLHFLIEQLVIFSQHHKLLQFQFNKIYTSQKTTYYFMIFRYKSYFSTIAVISGGARYDATAARLIDIMKNSSQNKVNVIGSIGEKYEDKLDEKLASKDILDHQEIIINRNYKETSIQTIICPFRTSTYVRNYLFVGDVMNEGFLKEAESNKFDAFVTVGNYGLMRYFYKRLADSYQKLNKLKPLMLGVDLSNANRSLDNETFLDFLYYNLPKSPNNLTKYVFPSMCIGYEGLFRAFQFLQKYRFNSENSSFLSKEFSIEVGELVKAARNEFRVSKGINEDHYLTVIGAGDKPKEIQFTLKVLKESVQKFAAHPNIKNISSDFFKFVVLLPENPQIAAEIKEKAAALQSHFEIIFVQPSEKYAAMCASDFALLHNGQITVEAAACQLPATVISSMSNYKAYLTYLYNGHDSPLNVSTNFEGYQELLGSLTALPSKIAEMMVDNFERPKLRFHYVKLYRQEIQKMLALNGKNPTLNVQKTGLELAGQDILEKTQAFKLAREKRDQNISWGRRREYLQFM